MQEQYKKQLARKALAERYGFAPRYPEIRVTESSNDGHWMRIEVGGKLYEIKANGRGGYEVKEESGVAESWS